MLYLITLAALTFIAILSYLAIRIQRSNIASFGTEASCHASDALTIQTQNHSDMERALPVEQKKEKKISSYEPKT